MSLAFLSGGIVFYFSIDILSELNFMMMIMMINDKNCSLTIVLTAMDQKLQKS